MGARITAHRVRCPLTPSQYLSRMLVDTPVSRLPTCDHNRANLTVVCPCTGAHPARGAQQCAPPQRLDVVGARVIAGGPTAFLSCLGERRSGPRVRRAVYSRTSPSITVTACPPTSTLEGSPPASTCTVMLIRLGRPISSPCSTTNRAAPCSGWITRDRTR